jgi:histidyl-tRNA synthetase
VVPDRIDVAIVPIGQRAEIEAVKLISLLRSILWRCDIAYRGNVKKRMQRANAINAKVAVIFGDDERDAGMVKVKNLSSGRELLVPLSGDIGAAIHQLTE